MPDLRIRTSAAPLRPEGDYVLYWMCAQRRTRRNFALQHAAGLAQRLGRPLLVLEALRVGYRWASDRLHHFVLQGMAVNRRQLQAAGVAVYSYVEPTPGAGRGLLEALAARACAVVTDEYPCFFLPRMLDAAERRLAVRLDRVDSNGLLPLREPGRDFATAHAFRRHLQKHLGAQLLQQPLAEPLEGLALPALGELPPGLEARWPQVDPAELADDRALLARLPIDHQVGPVALPGGAEAAQARLGRFVEQALDRYDQDRNEPSLDGSSRLSPHLHFGHLAAVDLVRAVLEREGWRPSRLSARTDGSRTGWWGVSPAAEQLLDQVVTWRELGFNFCWHHPQDYDRLSSLPPWALETIAEHADDRRERLYSLEELAQARTHDPIWNAAQRQLVREGWMHNYLRMLWGKKVLEWTPSVDAAREVLIELNNRYALDGRDPNSYSGIFWVLGRFDRAWGPVRPIFGKLRYMSSDNTARKWDLDGYLARYGA